MTEEEIIRGGEEAAGVVANFLEAAREFIMALAGANILFEYAEIFIAVVVVALIALFVATANKVLTKRTEKTKRGKWVGAFFFSVQTPLVVLIYVVGLTYTLEIFVHADQTRLISMAATTRSLGIVCCLLIFSLKFIRRIEDELVKKFSAAKNTSLDATGTRMITRILRLAMVIAALLTALSEVGISISGILAFGGVSGLAVGLAAKDPLANFLGAVMISLDKPFAEGDEIRSPDRNIEGFVEHIGWRITRINTYNGHSLYLPNSLFSTVIIENLTHMKLRYFDEVFALSYDDIDKIKDITSDIYEFLNNNADVDKDYINVIVRKFAESTINLAVECYSPKVDYEDFSKLSDRLLLGIAEIISKRGAKIAYPTQTLLLPEQMNKNSPSAPKPLSQP